MGGLYYKDYTKWTILNSVQLKFYSYLKGIHHQVQAYRA